MRALYAGVAITAAAALLAGCHNPRGRHHGEESSVASAQIGSSDAGSDSSSAGSSDAPNCKPVACTPSHPLDGSDRSGGSSATTSSSSERSASGSSTRYAMQEGRGGHRAATQGHRGGWRRLVERSWMHGGDRHPQLAGGPGSRRDGWSRQGWTRQGWTRQGSGREGWNREGTSREGLGRNWSRDEQAYGYGRSQAWRGEHRRFADHEAHYGYLDEPLDRGAFNDRYAVTRHTSGGGYERFYSEHHVVRPARTCAPGAWLSPDGRCVFARAPQVGLPGDFFYDNGGVGSDVVSGGGGGGGFVYGGGAAFGHASSFASARAYASAHASVSVHGGYHGGGHHGGHGGGCGCGGGHH